MEIKKILPVSFLYIRKEITMPELASMIPAARRLFKEAVRLDLHATGPVHWHYVGFNGDPVTPFTLDVCLPVASIPKDYDGDLHFKRTDVFRCVSETYDGNWTDMTHAYERMMKFVQENNLSMTGHTRELYVNADFDNPAANTTWIQLGIA